MHTSRFVSIGLGLMFCLLSAINTARAVPPTVGFTAIAVRNNVGTNTERGAGEGDGSPSRAIDGNNATATYLTTSNTSTNFSPQHVYLDLGGVQPVYGFRWNKTDEYVDPHTLSFLASTDGAALLSKTYSPVTGLSNGYYFGEEALPSGAFGGSTITGESNGAGVYSIMFNRVDATAIRFDFSSTGPFDHYHVNEFQAIVPEPSGMLFLCMAGGIWLRRGPRRA